MAKLRKRALSRVAGVAMIMQADAAMRAEVYLGVFQINRALAAGADAFG
jgi:hypothetical protein